MLDAGLDVVVVDEVCDEGVPVSPCTSSLQNNNSPSNSASCSDPARVVSTGLLRDSRNGCTGVVFTVDFPCFSVHEHFRMLDLWALKLRYGVST
jgi:hypothetical protein